MFVAQIDDVSKLATRASTKGIGTCELVDKEVANHFREFHKEKAQLRVVNKVKNISRKQSLRQFFFFFFFFFFFSNVFPRTASKRKTD
jgi:hypothetical protein